ncbi:heterokaryon incompatibility protein-domain-containing protein [Aspergillus granulosus]|uniref:Heterokaryon incompatibility protein-domain-containing protein n=1 Tax=Aspergillus granulosus TaxID=176169 RepID=A0ABR4H015_9EURO
MPKNVRYAALSYCWGKSSFFSTTRANFKCLKQDFNVSMLGQTLQDAVSVMRALGLHYIWIDALCIIQDDTQDWEKEVTTMADVYDNATITIAAFSAASVSEGFLHSRCPTPFTKQWTNGCGVTTALTARLQVVTGLHALDHNLFGSENPFLDPVQRRGWCFQEEILSRRLVIYSTNEVQWLCRSEKRCECSHASAIASTSFLAQLRQDPFGFWAEKLPEYTERSFTFWKDRLPALSGLASVVQSLTSSDYVAGVWLKDLTRSLSWTASPSDIKPCSSGYQAPSFSWASIDSPIYEFDERYASPDHSMITLVDWTIERKGIDPLGEVKNATLTVSGFVHHATMTYDESLWRDTFRVDIAGRTAELHQDTHLERFQTTGLSDHIKTYSARRSERTTPPEQEWDGGVNVLAMCLLRDPDRVTAFLILVTPPGCSEVERIGIAEFLHSENRWEQSDASEAWISEIENPQYWQTLVLA